MGIESLKPLQEKKKQERVELSTEQVWQAIVDSFLISRGDAIYQGRLLEFVSNYFEFPKNFVVEEIPENILDFVVTWRTRNLGHKEKEKFEIGDDTLERITRTSVEELRKYAKNWKKNYSPEKNKKDLSVLNLELAEDMIGRDFFYVVRTKGSTVSYIKNYIFGQKSPPGGRVFAPFWEMVKGKVPEVIQSGQAKSYEEFGEFVDWDYSKLWPMIDEKAK